MIEMLKTLRQNPYKVKKGQTLLSLSQELSTTPYALVAENGLTEELFEGQLLQLPPPANLYTVQAGDTKTLVCGSEENYRNKNGTDVFYIGMRILL